MSTVVTLAVSGPAPCAYKNVEPLLNDWLGLGDKDSEGNFTLLKNTDPELQINVIAPITGTRYTEGVAAVLDWAEPAVAKAIALTDGDDDDTTNDAQQALINCSQRVMVDDIDDAILEVLDHHRRVGKVALLVCFDPETPDAATIALMVKAKFLDIPIFNLSLGLFPIDADDYSGALEDAVAEENVDAEQPPGEVDIDFSKSVMRRIKATQEPEQLDAFAAVAETEADAPAGQVELDAENAGDQDVPTEVLWEQLDWAVGMARGVMEKLRVRLGDAPATVKISDRPAAELPPIPVVMTAQVKPVVKTRKEFRMSPDDEWNPAGRGRPRGDWEYREVPIGS
jgi:hypothetical protein